MSISLIALIFEGKAAPNATIFLPHLVTLRKIACCATPATRVLAVASIYRDIENLQAGLAMEQGT